MYLPLIMIERFGWPGFIAFAVPNVIGCAVFGYVVRNRARSEAMIAQHGGMMTAFSVVTVAYHMFFMVWLFTELIGRPAPEGTMARSFLAAVIVFLLGLVLSFLDNRDWLVLAALVYLLSLTTFGMIGIEPLKSIAWQGTDNTRELGWLAPVLVFGFLLCPYLDLTFHRAIQNSPSRHSFAVFGIAFFVMLLLTCAIWFSGNPLLRGAALAHLLAQSVFTVGAHLREVRVSPVLKDRDWRVLVMVLPLLAAPLLFIGRLFTNAGDLGDGLYLRFLVFYGLVFPAYVLLFTRLSGRTLNTNRRRVIIFTLIIVAALPFYEMGFLHDRTWMLMIPLLAFAALTLRPGHSVSVDCTIAPGPAEKPPGKPGAM